MRRTASDLLQRRDGKEKVSEVITVADHDAVHARPKLAGKVAIVTGAGRGVGAATATRFAEEAAAVVCVDIDGAGAERTALAARRAGGDALALQLDVSTESGNAEMVARAVAEFGGLDVLHANAAIQHMASLEDTSEEIWDSTHATNLRGVYLAIGAARPRLRERGGGSIIITSSLLGLVGNPDLPAYGATKGALRAMCRSFAVTCGPDGIRVNTICPGDVDTELLQQYFDFQPDPAAARREIEERYPLRRFASPVDVANVAIFLASDDSAYLTGST
jgi:NAD(P)-dependent dehydrogenase (short-subunit alcohol dehydrogenase family)